MYDGGGRAATPNGDRATAGYGREAYEERAMVFWLTQTASWLAGKVPRRLRLALAGPLTTLVYYAWVSKRRVTIANMAQILEITPSDPRARQAARDSWRTMAAIFRTSFICRTRLPRLVLARMRDASGELGFWPH